MPQQSVFRGGEVDLPSAAPRLTGVVVQDQVSVGRSFPFPFGTPVAQQHLGPREDLGDPERLGDVVLPAGTEFGDESTQGLIGGQEEHRGAISRA